MTSINNFTEHQLDILKEVGNIGSGNAATALSKILKTKVSMETPSVRIASFEETFDLVGGSDEIVLAVFLRIEGEAPGNVFFVLPPWQAEKLVHQITGSDDFTLRNASSSTFGISVLQEVANILSGSYLSALADLTQLNFQSSVPSLKLDMAGAILAEGLLELSSAFDYAIIIDTTIEEFASDSQLIQAHLFLLPDPGSFAPIFAALGAVSE